MKQRNKGVAGLTILLSLITMLFVIGLLIMIFVIMGEKLRTSTYDTTTVVATNETVTTLNNTVGDSLSKSTLRDVVCSVSVVTNATGGETVPATNYTMTNCLIKGATTSAFMNRNVNVTYSYTYERDNTATTVMNDTVNGIASTTDWYDIFIVIGAMVVLILLVVLIITAIRNSGMVDGGHTGQNTVGTA